MSWGRDNVKNFASNIYLYLSKGSSKWVINFIFYDFTI
jgi:hypothetical protein